MNWLRDERGIERERLRRAVALVGDRPGRLLGRHVGVLRHPRQHPVRAGARPPDHARRRVVHGRAAELRRAPGGDRGRSRPGRGGGPLADAAAARADLRRATRTRRPGARGAPAPRRVPGRSGGGLHAEHPRDARGVHRHGQPGRDLGHLCAGVRGSQRGRAVRADRAARAAHRRRLRLPRPLRRSPGRGRGDPFEATDAPARRERPLRRGTRRRRRGVGGPDRRGRAARVRPGRRRPPSVRAVLLRDDRPAQADRPRPRAPAGRAPQEPGARLGPQARRPAAVVLDHGMDDVERARRRRCCCAPRS